MKSQQKKSERIAALEAEVAELRAQVSSLQAQISTLQPKPEPWTWPRVTFANDCGYPTNTLCGNVVCPRAPRVTSDVHGVGTVTEAKS